MKRADLPLVRGGELPQEALRLIARVAQFFPGCERDIIIIRQKPISPLPRDDEKGISSQREKA
jgi:hypothetical protein